MQRIARAAETAGVAPPRLLAVGKTRHADELSNVLDAMRRLTGGASAALGENYVQEAAAKQAQLGSRDIEWHLIGHLQSNKAARAGVLFDWVQTVDRLRLVPLLAGNRPADRPPLNVLVQVNIDDEASKDGCRPRELHALAEAIVAQPRLRLRGLMAIPAPPPAGSPPCPTSFMAMRDLFEALRADHPGVDTLSMGMSDDLEIAVASGSTMVRIGTALFGPRAATAVAATQRRGTA